MASEKIEKVLSNMDQGLTSTEKARARANIGAVSASEVPAAQVNADWDAVSGAAEILHKPNIQTYTAGTGIDITSGTISEKVVYVYTTSSYSSICSLIDGGYLPVLEVANGSNHNYFYVTHKSGTHVDFVGSMGYNTNPTYTSAGYMLRYTIDDSNQWTVTRFDEQWPKSSGLLATYTVTSTDVSNGYVLLPVATLPYPENENVASFSCDVVGLYRTQGSMSSNLNGIVSNIEAFTGDDGGSLVSYPVRTITGDLIRYTDSGSDVHVSSGRFHFEHIGGEFINSITKLYLKLTLDSTGTLPVAVGDVFSWQGMITQFR